MKSLASFEARAEAMRARVRLRSWELRQLHRAKGSWHRLRLTLARAEDAYAVDDATIQELLAEGFSKEPVGDEFEPRRSYVFVPAERAACISSRRALTIRLSAEFLGSPAVVLVPF
jgi:hypothetical protein